MHAVQYNLSMYKKIFTFTVAKCESLPDPENGQVTLTGLYQGSTATYTCNPTYELNGDSMRLCNTSALWTNAAPFCECKYLLFHSRRYEPNYVGQSFIG